MKEPEVSKDSVIGLSEFIVTQYDDQTGSMTIITEATDVPTDRCKSD